MSKSDDFTEPMLPEASEAPPKRKRGRPRKVETVGLQEKPSTDYSQQPLTPEGTAWDALEHPEKYALPRKMQGFAAQKAEVIRGDAPREQLNVRVRAELKQAVQILAVTQNLTLGDIVEEALIDYIKNKKNP